MQTLPNSTQLILPCIFRARFALSPTLASGPLTGNPFLAPDVILEELSTERQVGSPVGLRRGGGGGGGSPSRAHVPSGDWRFRLAASLQRMILYEEKVFLFDLFCNGDTLSPVHACTHADTQLARTGNLK